MLGPLRNCIYPRIFRSVSVKNAIAIRAGTISRSKFTMNMLLRRGVEPLVVKF